MARTTGDQISTAAPNGSRRRWACLFVDTQLALAKPRRAIPILVVATPLVYAQAVFSHAWSAIGLAMVMCVAFTTFGPFSWRLLFPAGVKVRWPALRLLIFVAIGALVTFLIGFLLARALGFRVTFITSAESNMVTATLFWVGGWGLGRDIDLEQSLSSEKERAEGLRREAERAQLLAIRNHLDPHFLFNTLNAIAEWCREDGEVAERAVLELSSMLRVVFTGVRESEWDLGKEIDLVETLMSLHRTRDPGLFTVVRDLEDPLPMVAVPPMILLPVFENAMKHGPCAGHRGEVRVGVKIEGDSLLVTVSNPGGYAGRRDGGEGITMVEQRLDLAYDGAAQLDLESVEDGTRTQATLRLPVTGPRAGVLT